MFLRIPAMKPSFAARRRTSRLRGLLMSGTLFHLHAAALHAAEAPVYCNPLDLPLAAEKGWRHAADPVLVSYQNRWWLFTTWDFDGYRVSDDLLNWRDVRFDPSVRGLALDRNGEYCGPAVAVWDGWMIFIGMQESEKKGYIPVLRTRDPDSGKWEKCGEVPAVPDPSLFEDDGRLFLYHGLGEGAPTGVMEIDTRTFTPLPGSEKQLRPRIHAVNELAGGIELGRRELADETDTAAFLGKFRMLPCQEGTWMTKAGDRYYLQYATPGTITQWYSDVVMEGPTPLGPFHHVPWSPASMMAGGFIGSAGHGCMVRDSHGNWLRMSTMWIGVHDRFERRVGLFPAGFDPQGRMFTDTAFGDYPQELPARPGAVKLPADNRPKWMLVSEQTRSSASSSADGHPPELGSDENVRTWWAARSGRAGEWFAVDLGEERTVHAVQVNLAEHDPKRAAKAPADAGQSFVVEASADGVKWKPVWNRSRFKAPSAHPLHVFAPPIRTRHLRVVNASDSEAGAFAIRDLRAFGKGNGEMPALVSDLVVRRNKDDERFASFHWSPAGRADGYVLRFGAAPDALHLAIRIRGGETSDFTTHVLNRAASYHFRLDSFNENGVTRGKVVASPPQ